MRLTGLSQARPATHETIQDINQTSTTRQAPGKRQRRWETLFWQLPDAIATPDLQPLEGGKAVQPCRKILKIIATNKLELLQGREELERSLLLIHGLAMTNYPNMEAIWGIRVLANS
uniref:Uncharacterized protein n=1 Tax=Oryza barthii TaxID=65489 RepID=A0A0D3HJU1_9ORYZ